VNDDIIAGNPVDGGGDLVLVTGLERVDDAENLSGVAASGGGVGEDGADGLLGVDDEDGSDGEGNALGVDVGGVLEVKPVTLLETRFHSILRGICSLFCLTLFLFLPLLS